MINKKVLTILIMSLMFTLLVGCSSVKEYSYDYNKISEKYALIRHDNYFIHI